MSSAMSMQLVRGEGPLEPSTFLSYYALLLPPCIAWVAVIALVFECAPGLGGRVGDVLYFFVWSITLALGAEPWRKPGEPISWLGRCLDYAGFGLVIGQVRRLAGTDHFSIGYNPVDLARPTTTFPGLDLSAQAWATRSAALVLPLLLLPLALLLFRRFDPARTRARDGGRWRSASAPLARLARWMGRPALALLDRLPPDAALSFRIRPLLVFPAAASVALGLILPAESVRQVLLPVLFAVLSVALADIATRERQAGMAATLFAAPGRRREAF